MSIDSLLHSSASLEQHLASSSLGAQFVNLGTTGTAISHEHGNDVNSDISGDNNIDINVEFSSGHLTLFGQALTTEQVESICEALVPVLTLLAPLQAHQYHQRFGDTVVFTEVRFRSALLAEIKEQIATLAQQYYCEICLQLSRPALAEPGLLVMDMDSTVIQIECIDEIAKLAGLGEQVAAVTAKAMRGELAFSESLISRVQCLTDVPVAQLQKIRDSIPLMPGVAALVTELKQHNWKVAIASGGFTYFAQYLQQRLGLDDSFANTLEEHDGKLTGKVLGEIVDAEVKARVVRSLGDKYEIAPNQTIAMGDGANDLVMMSASALGVACHAKPLVNQKADVAIRYTGLHSLLYLLQ